MSTVLRHARIERDLTQAELAALLRCSQASIAYYESGKRRPRRPTRELLEKIFGMPAAELLAETQNAADSDVDGVQKVHLPAEEVELHVEV